MSTSYVDASEALPSTHAFYLTFAAVDDSINTASLLPNDDDGERHYTSIAHRSDNHTPLDLMSYGEIMDALCACLAQYWEDHADYYHLRLSPNLITMPDPSYIYDRPRDFTSHADTLPGAYMGSYMVEHGTGPLAHEHHYPLLITSNLPSMPLIRRMFTGTRPVARIITTVGQVLHEQLGGQDGDSITPFTLLKPTSHKDA